jgi:hypothetical protein
MASLAVVDKRNPDNLTAAQVLAELEQHLLPGTVVVPSAFAEIARLQLAGFALVVIPKQPTVGPWTP